MLTVLQFATFVQDDADTGNKEEEPNQNHDGDTQAEEAVNAGDANRQSRRLLSETTTIPQYLKDRYPMPSEVQPLHVVHKTTTLPHYQVKLTGGQLYEGKLLAAV